MPELAEVEYFRQRWHSGLGQTILAVSLHPRKRIFRGLDPSGLREALPGARLSSSEARGKQMVFRFSNGAWLGVHLGMTGELRAEEAGFKPGRHDHLVLHQQERALVLSDARQFGRVMFDPGPAAPNWWAGLPAALTSKAFTPASLETFLQRHRRAPIKAVLLLQDGFPGIGNWMADEILWRARIDPRTPVGHLVEPRAIQRLWRVVRQVCRGALRHVSQDFSDPPKGWLFNERWDGQGKCPRHRRPLRRARVGGRTTAWCPVCQREPAR